MIAPAVAKHYSKALFNLAKSDGQLEKTAVALKEITGLFKSNPEFSAFLFQPFVKTEVKKSLLKKLFQENSNPELLEFLFFLLDKKRIELLPDIAAGYEKLVNAKLGKLEVGITTTVAIDSEMKDKIKQALEKRFQKKVLVNDNIDPQILGGMVLKIGNHVMDGSIKAQLSKLKDHLLATTV